MVITRFQCVPRMCPRPQRSPPFGLFEFLLMPFSLKAAAQAFQGLMDLVLRDLTFAFVYLDDLCGMNELRKR